MIEINEYYARRFSQNMSKSGVKMTDCNKTENYLETRKRMCTSFGHCSSCPACVKPNYDCLLNFSTEGYSHKKAIEIVQQWSNEHPKKRIVDEFLEKYPNSNLAPTSLCPFELLGIRKECKYYCEDRQWNVCEECWNLPIDEVTKDDN